MKIKQENQNISFESWRKSSIVIILVSIIVLLLILFDYNLPDKKQINDQALDFKEEYEYYNNKKYLSNENSYINVTISEDNVIKYSTYDEIIEIIKGGTGVILLSNPENPSSRNIVPLILESANENNLDVIYYLDIYQDREVLMLDENNNIKIQQEGTKKYLELVNILDKYLTEYTLTNNTGNIVQTGKKKIDIPSVIFVKDGIVLNIKSGTMDTQTNLYSILTDREKDDLLTEYNNYMEQIVL